MNTKQIIFLAMIGMIGCKKDDAATRAFNQDARLVGGWRLDSMLWGSQMNIGGPGQYPFDDSVRFEKYNQNSSPPAPDMSSFFRVNDSVYITLQDYFWETYSSDSLGLSLYEHKQEFSHTYGYSILGNQLIIHWSQSTLNQFTTPPSPLVATSYFHR